MTNTFIKTTLMAVVIGLGAFGINAATATQAQASHVDVGIYFDGGSFGFGFNNGHGHGHYGHGHHRPHRYTRRACNSRKALRKARRMGVRHAGVTHRSRRSVVVKGWKHGHRIKVRFANQRRCPVVSVRRR